MKVKREWFIETLSKCGIEKEKEKVARRAEEILRILNVKIPAGSQVVKNDEQCRPGVALELAWRETGSALPLDRQKLAKASMCLPRNFQNVLSHAEKIIMNGTKASTEEKIDALDIGFLACSVLGHNRSATQIAQRCRQLIERRTEHLRKKGRSGDGRGDRAVHAAAFYEIATQYFNADIQPRALLTMVGGVTASEFRRARDEIGLLLEEFANNKQQDQGAQNLPQNNSNQIPDKEFASLRAQHALRFAEKVGNRKRSQPSEIMLPPQLPAIEEEASDNESIGHNHQSIDIWARDALRNALGSEPPPFTSLDAIQSAFDALLSSDSTSSTDTNVNDYPSSKRQRTVAAVS